MVLKKENFLTDLIVAKICALIILAISSTIAGILPILIGEYFLKKGSSNASVKFDKIMSFFLYFGGGVLLCTVFLHLLPEIRNNVELLEKENIIKKFVLSYPELVMCVGFFMMFLVEEMVHSFLLPTISNTKYVESPEDLKSSTVFTLERKNSCTKTDVVVEPCSFSNTENKEIKEVFEANKNYHSCENDYYCHTVSAEHIHVINNLSKHSVSSLLTVLALSVHEIFEGLAIGLERKPAMVWYLLLAVSCHKVVLAAFIGVQFMTSKMKSKIANIFVVMFALTSPIGITAGILMSESSNHSDVMSIVSVILQALATGTLLYIVFFEIYKRQFKMYSIPGIVKLFASILGFVFMAFIQIELSS